VHDASARYRVEYLSILASKYYIIRQAAILLKYAKTINDTRMPR
jgi:hypothetical protein